MGLLAGFMRIYSYLFHGLLCLLLLILAFLGWISGAPNFQLPIFPWKDTALLIWLAVLGLAGLGAIVLAILGNLRIVFFVWTLAVAVVLIRGYLFSGYTFSGAADFRNTMLLLLGALLAVAGGWFTFRRTPARR